MSSFKFYTDKFSYLPNETITIYFQHIKNRNDRLHILELKNFTNTITYRFKLPNKKTDLICEKKQTIIYKLNETIRKYVTTYHFQTTVPNIKSGVYILCYNYTKIFFL